MSLSKTGVIMRQAASRRNGHSSRREGGADAAIDAPDGMRIIAPGRRTEAHDGCEGETDMAVDVDLRQSLLAAARRVASVMMSAPGMVGALAGGSLGRGGAIDRDSDADIWLLYRGAPPDMSILERLWRSLGAQPVEGGEWVVDGWRAEVSAHESDALFESLDRLIAREEPGAPDADAHWLYYTVALADPHGIVRDLRQKLRVYPESLRCRLVAQSLQSMDKPARQARILAERGDLPAWWLCAGAFITAFAEGLFAHNHLWHPGPKRLLDLHLARCREQPPDCAARLKRLLALDQPASLQERAEILQGLRLDAQMLFSRYPSQLQNME